MNNNLAVQEHVRVLNSSEIGKDKNDNAVKFQVDNVKRISG